MNTNHLVLGMIAHVDAGKTTLSEQILYQCGVIAKTGRVDHQDTFLDTHSLERERGITIFSKQALITLKDLEITLLDTPGHVDFSAEMERTLQVLDYGILVINGSDGVQSHTRTLWKLLKQYQIPVFVFVNKMDQPGNRKEPLLQELKEKLSADCVDFTLEEDDFFYEEIAVREEALMERFLEGEVPKKEEIQTLIEKRQVFPVFFGSALKGEGIKEFLDGLSYYLKIKNYPEQFGARVFKIQRDSQNNRLTYVKVTGGNLKVKQLLEGREYQKKEEWQEKVDQIRFYSGDSFHTSGQAAAGQICVLTGLSQTYAGEGIGEEKQDLSAKLEPVLTCCMEFEPQVNVYQAYEKLAVLMEEDPQLYMEWKERTNEIHIKVMGDIQMEVLKRIIKERFGLEVTFGPGQIIYKETIANTVEGVGHFEPLRHYAEVHLLLEPLPLGSGMQFTTRCSEDVLDKNWQRLIMTHLEERQHVGVLTGSAITDMRITILTGKAHAKHTEGGDFRQATYRAIRHGLCKAESILLEPVYEFTLEVPDFAVGRAMSDVQRMNGEVFMAPESGGQMTLLTGTCPVVTMQEYQREVLSYTKGLGKLSLQNGGYRPCHNTEEVLERTSYQAMADLDNPCGSVFCEHGAGVYVDWQDVEGHMHLELVYQEKSDRKEEGNRDKQAVRRQTTDFIDQEEIETIINRTFHANTGKKNVPYKYGASSREKRISSSQMTKVYQGKPRKESYLLVDGYNVIFAWKELKELAATTIDGARGKLMDILCDYQAMKGCHLILVFDAYRLQGHPVEVLDYHNIKVVYTKEAETADQYIEKFAHAHAKDYSITVATSDGLEQVIIRGQGCTLLSARELYEEVTRSKIEFKEQHMEKQKEEKTYFKDYLPTHVIGSLEKGE